MPMFEISNRRIFIKSPFEPNGDSIDDAIERHISGDRIPFWIEVWPSAVGLSEFIFESDEFAGKTVLELGCGLGLTSVALGFQGAFLTATDYDVQALNYARENFLLNIGTLEKARFVYLDWRYPTLREKFDFVIGSDIIYDRELFDSIINVLKIAMRYNSVCYLADPNRSSSHEFFKKLGVEGFDSTIVSRKKVSYRDANVDVLIHRVKKMTR